MVSDGLRGVPDINTIVKIIYFLRCEKLIFTSTSSVCSLNCVASIITVKGILRLGLELFKNGNFCPTRTIYIFNCPPPPTHTHTHTLPIPTEDTLRYYNCLLVFRLKYHNKSFRVPCITHSIPNRVSLRKVGAF
jgi:hypothetical protein